MLRLENVRVSFRKEVQKKIFGAERKVVLHDVSFEARRGECLGILGESGSGKSTIGRVVCGLLKPDRGLAAIEGAAIYGSRRGRRLLRDKIAVVFQDYTTSANPRFLIADVIAEGIAAGERKGGERRPRKEEVGRLLRLVGLDESFAHRFPHELSGGQLQRVCIARAIACRPELVLFDEAVSSLDAHTQVQVMDLLLDLKAKLGLTYIFITHDLTAVTYFCDRVLILQGGRIMASSPVADLAAIQDDYAEKLLASVLDFG